MIWCYLKLKDFFLFLPEQTFIIRLKSYPLRNIWKATLQDIDPTLPVSFIVRYTMLLHNCVWLSWRAGPKQMSFITVSQHPLIFNPQRSSWVKTISLWHCFINYAGLLILYWLFSRKEDNCRKQVKTQKSCTLFVSIWGS